MAVQLSVAVRNARLDSIETAIGTSGVLKIFSGAQPANCAAADSGTQLAQINLDSDWAAAASSGSKAFQGTLEDVSADADGTAGHFRVYASGATVCHMQGSVTASGGGGDLIVSNTSFTTGDTFTITSLTLTDANA